MTINNDWKRRYEKEKPWGMLTSIDIHDCDPNTIRDAKKIKEYVRGLLKEIDMKAFGETVVVNFGEDEKVAGFSMTQLIETSLVSGHFANHTNRSFIDIFSCKAYDPHAAALYTEKFFGGKTKNIHIIFRD